MNTCVSRAHDVTTQQYVTKTLCVDSINPPCGTNETPARDAGESMFVSLCSIPFLFLSRVHQLRSQPQPLTAPLHVRTTNNATHNTAPVLFRPRGISIVAVLAILVVLSVMAMVFVQNTRIFLLVGQSHMAKMQADLLADSAMQHTMSVLRDARASQPQWDDISQQWSASFRPTRSTRSEDIVRVDSAHTPIIAPQYARWHYVRDARGALVGRYAIRVTDEASKININSAAALGPQMQNQGVGTFEVLLACEQKNAGLPVSLAFAKNLMRYRYGRDLRPGQADVDDNFNALLYETDLIDNNADGRIDEPGEGIDEPQEYTPIAPMWDDRAFSSLREAAFVGLNNSPPSRALVRALHEYGTIYTACNEEYWSHENSQFQKRLNINVATRRQLQAMLRIANRHTHFEPSSRNMRSLVANLMDYRDENHVLTTVGNEYGIEAVCFNEIMANDGSFTFRADQNSPSRDSIFAHRLGWWYERPEQSEIKEYGWKIRTVMPFSRSGTVRMNGRREAYTSAARIRLYDSPERLDARDRPAFNQLRTLLNQYGGWPADIFKNATLNVLASSGIRDQYISYPIIGNDGDTLTIGFNNTTFRYSALTNIIATGEPLTRINTRWRDTEGGLVCLFPEAHDLWFFPTHAHRDFRPPDNLYYKVYVADQNLPGTIDERQLLLWGEDEGRGQPSSRPWKGFYPYLDVNGNPRQYSETQMLEIRQEDLSGTDLQMPGGVSRSYILRTPYKDGEPVRARNGYIPVLVGTTRHTGYVNGRSTSDSVAFRNKNTFQTGLFMRPDIVELINISDHPISLKNWRIVINTGSYADELGRIERAMEYNPVRRQRLDNTAPAIQAGGYFYLTNYRDIFALEYGSGSTEWGLSAQEMYPVYELPNALWGVRYHVSAVRDNLIFCEGANWEVDQLKYEMVEWHLRQPRADQNAAFGLRFTIQGNTRNAIRMGDNVRVVSLRAGDDVLIVGMPRSGGFLSMTLKNEYNQITARTVDYGSTDINEIGYSMEKFDPTHYTWIKQPNPTFGGTPARARNHASMRASGPRPYVKNNRFATIGEIQNVRKAEDWQNIGMERAGAESIKTLHALAPYFTTAGVRLDASEPEAHISGWRKAGGAVRSSMNNTLTATDVRWEPGIWAGQTLRILTGEQKGEAFSIINSTASGVTIEGYSTPGMAQLRVQPGDLFSVGPGYVTPLFYTRTTGDQGIWEWRNKGLEKQTYGVYLFGLNDSILTTEFLEENYNALITAEIFNHDTRDYETLPLPSERGVMDLDDPYSIIPSGARHRYEKTDNMFLGAIGPAHISAEGGIRLRLTAHGLGAQHNSGFAWFDYVFLTPTRTYGKINVNTASERVLRSLNIPPRVARALAEGRPRGGNGTLKPYTTIADILHVDGMTADMFGRICNKITVRSDQFHITIIAQALKDTQMNGVFNEEEGDAILSQIRREVVIDRSNIAASGADAGHFNVSVLE